MDISTWDIPVRNYSDTHALSACLPLQCYTEWIHTSPFADSQGASAPAPSTASSKATPAVLDDPQETTFYEGSGAPAELAISLLLGLLIIPIPLTIASIGRRLWISYRFTNKRIIVTNTSPLFSRQVRPWVLHFKQHCILCIQCIMPDGWQTCCPFACSSQAWLVFAELHYAAAWLFCQQLGLRV